MKNSSIVKWKISDILLPRFYLFNWLLHPPPLSVPGRISPLICCKPSSLPALFHDFRVAQKVLSKTEQCSSKTKGMLFALIVLIAFIAAVSSSETIKATIFADNYFEFYVNGFIFISFSSLMLFTVSLTYSPSLITIAYYFPHLFALTHLLLQLFVTLIRSLYLHSSRCVSTNWSARLYSSSSCWIYIWCW